MIIIDTENVFVFIVAGFERFNTEAAAYSALTQKEKNRSYDLIYEYLRSSPECTEIFNVLSDKEIYYKPEVELTSQISKVCLKFIS